jgi:hypothetical protein
MVFVLSVVGLRLRPEQADNRYMTRIQQRVLYGNYTTCAAKSIMRAEVLSISGSKGSKSLQQTPREMLRRTARKCYIVQPASPVLTG